MIPVLQILSSVLLKVYNDADILEKILTDRRRDLGPVRDEDDAMSPKLKISTSLRRASLLSEDRRS